MQRERDNQQRSYRPEYRIENRNPDYYNHHDFEQYRGTRPERRYEERYENLRDEYAGRYENEPRYSEKNRYNYEDRYPQYRGREDRNFIERAGDYIRDTWDNLTGREDYNRDHYSRNEYLAQRDHRNRRDNYDDFERYNYNNYRPAGRNGRSNSYNGYETRHYEYNQPGSARPEPGRMNSYGQQSRFENNYRPQNRNNEYGYEQNQYRGRTPYWRDQEEYEF
jgi:hypothetical protein